MGCGAKRRRSAAGGAVSREKKSYQLEKMKTGLEEGLNFFNLHAGDRLNYFNHLAQSSPRLLPFR